MKRIVILVLLGMFCLNQTHAQVFRGQYISEWQWDMNKNTNLVNQLRLELSIPIGNGKDSFEAATLHVAKTNDGIIDDWQGFSNIDEDNHFALLAVLGYMHEWNSGHLFAGVRNVNEDFFTSGITSLFLNSSEGIFPTIASSYPIANYPHSGLTLYFDVTKGRWTFKNSLNNGAGYSGWKAHDNPFLVRPKRMESSTCRSWNIIIKVGNILQVLPFIPVNIRSMRMAKWYLLMNPGASLPVPGGSMVNRRFGILEKRRSPAWCSIPRIRVIRMLVTGMQKWAVPIRMKRTSVACLPSMPVSSREQNVLWRLLGKDS